MLTALRQFLTGGRRSAKQGARNFTGAGTSRLSLDWVIAPLSADAAMRGKLSSLRTRCRDLERNNEWARGFLRTLENNVVGEAGITLQMRIREIGRDGTERFDEIANDKIENAWWQWGRKGKCTICGRHTWRDVQRIVVRSLGRDGEILIRKITTRQGLKLQLIEADLLDENANYTASNGNETAPWSPIIYSAATQGMRTSKPVPEKPPASRPPKSFTCFPPSARINRAAPRGSPRP